MPDFPLAAAEGYFLCWGSPDLRGTCTGNVVEFPGGEFRSWGGGVPPPVFMSILEELTWCPLAIVTRRAETRRGSGPKA